MLGIADGSVLKRSLRGSKLISLTKGRDYPSPPYTLFYTSTLIISYAHILPRFSNMISCFNTFEKMIILISGSTLPTFILPSTDSLKFIMLW